MAPKEPTRAQLSSRLTYQQNKPAFLQKLQNKIAGIQDDDEDDEEFEEVGNGREPIPRRPRAPIPERPVDDPGSTDEDDDDEKPQVVVLKAGKHITALEAENVRRKEKGLPPLPDPGADLVASQPSSSSKDASNSRAKVEGNGLSFSSKSTITNKSAKRKAIGQPDDDKDGNDKKGSKVKQKKPKKEKKTLLSFNDDA